MYYCSNKPLCLANKNSEARLGASLKYGPLVFLTACFPKLSRSCQLQVEHCVKNRAISFSYPGVSHPKHYFNGIPLYLSIQMDLKANKTFKGRRFFLSRKSALVKLVNYGKSCVRDSGDSGCLGMIPWALSKWQRVGGYMRVQCEVPGNEPGRRVDF